MGAGKWTGWPSMRTSISFQEIISLHHLKSFRKITSTSITSSYLYLLLQDSRRLWTVSPWDKTSRACHSWQGQSPSHFCACPNLWLWDFLKLQQIQLGVVSSFLTLAQPFSTTHHNNSPHSQPEYFLLWFQYMQHCYVQPSRQQHPLPSIFN